MLSQHLTTLTQKEPNPVLDCILDQAYENARATTTGLPTHVMTQTERQLQLLKKQTITIDHYPHLIITTIGLDAHTSESTPWQTDIIQNHILLLREKGFQIDYQLKLGRPEKNSNYLPSN